MTGQVEMFDPLDADPLDLIAHMGDVVPAKHRWPEYLADLFELMQAYNLRKKMSMEESAIDARDRCMLMAKYHGGRMHYLPTGETLERALRDVIIFKEFRGNNHEALAAKWDLTITRIYQILAEQTKLFQKERQGKLFNHGEGE